MTTTALDWCASEELIMERWLVACEGQDRHSKVFEPLRLSNRLKRLLAVAYCYDIWPLIKDKRCRNAVDIAEKYADNQASKQQLVAAADAADAYAVVAAAAYAAYTADATDAYAAVTAVAAARAAVAAVAAADVYAYAGRKEKWVIHGKLLVSVIGPGWVFDSQWRTSTAIAIATQMYESRDFSAMPILADALQDAGCEEETLLQQMRNSESKWCRGCRILDELLGKR